MLKDKFLEEKPLMHFLLDDYAKSVGNYADDVIPNIKKRIMNDFEYKNILSLFHDEAVNSIFGELVEVLDNCSDNIDLFELDTIDFVF